MSMQRNIRAITDVLEGLGIFGAIIEKGRKHVKVLIEGPLGSRQVFTSASPSDHRTMMNFRTDARRIAREVGAIA